MSPFQRHRWFIAAAGTILAFAVVSLTAHKSDGLAGFADVVELALMLLGAAASLSNLLTRPGPERSFWSLMALGLSLWAGNQAYWVHSEIWLHRQISNPNFFDIILFFHLIPMIAATAWRPDLLKREGRVHLGALNFLMLLGWWIFLYAFIVFPHQYVVLNVPLYNVEYDWLYLLENVLFLGLLGLAAFTCTGGWRRLYLHFLSAAALYTIGSQMIDRLAASNTYYSGSIADMPLIGTAAWTAAAAMSAREWNLTSVEPRSDSRSLDPRWTSLVPRLAMLAMLSLPILGLWTVFFDKSPSPTRGFRVFVVLFAMFLLGSLVFMRQYFQDKALMRLLHDSRLAYESQNRLQKQLVLKEKLASLGTLVAGAAHEINHPLDAVMGYSEQLWAQEKLSSQQNTLLRKIVNQARRTRDLVNDLLSFAQQAPGEKTPVDLNVLLARATQMLEARHAAGKIRVTISVETNFPRVQGNANQLFQAFVEIIENALDALDENGGGLLQITAHRQANEAVLQFSDTGPGIREPQRVFDPFYTTKPVGKGTGLGLSAVYGVIQEHSGQITCQNKPEGGALFVVKFPVATEPTAVQVAGATGD